MRTIGRNALLMTAMLLAGTGVAAFPDAAAWSVPEEKARTTFACFQSVTSMLVLSNGEAGILASRPDKGIWDVEETLWLQACGVVPSACFCR